MLRPREDDRAPGVSGWPNRRRRRPDGESLESRETSLADLPASKLTRTETTAGFTAPAGAHPPSHGRKADRPGAGLAWRRPSGSRPEIRACQQRRRDDYHGAGARPKPFGRRPSDIDFGRDAGRRLIHIGLLNANGLN